MSFNQFQIVPTAYDADAINAAMKKMLGNATLEELGVEFGISKERVRQIESRAMEKLRSALVSADPHMAAYA